MKVYRASSYVSHALVRSRSREELLNEVVRVLVEVGGFAMVFIALDDPESHMLVPVARFGDEQGHADNIRIFLDERPEGRGPTATAFRTGVPYISNDFLNDPCTLPWRNAARASGWRASAAFPILGGGSPRGVLNIYAHEPHAFDPDRVELLTQVALDLAMGLERLEAEDRRRCAEEGLAASEHRLKLAMDAAAVATFDADLATRTMVWDGPHERIVGFPPGDFDDTYTGAGSRVHPNDLARLQREVAEARDTRRNFCCEFRVVRPDALEQWIYCRGGFQYDDSGRPYRLAGAVLDVTDRKRIEAALAKSEERLRQAVRVSQIGIFDHDHATDVIYWSPEQRVFFGWGPDEPVTLPKYFACVHPADREKIIAAVKQAHNPEGDGSYDLEHRILLPDGSVRWAKIRSQTFFEGEGSRRHPVRTVGALRDITDEKQAEAERSKLEEHLMQAQKLESIGRLAGGIAHDFNNLLTVINGYSQMLLGQLPAGDPRHITTEQILKAGERAAGLTRQLLAFSRKQVLQSRMLDLNRVVKDMRPMLERLMGEDVDVTVALDARSGSVYADQHQLEQVIMNLAVNARDAMSRGGRLRIETAGVHLDESYVRLHPATQAGEYVMLAMSDTGVGIEKETQQQIFEPFFTTKPVGQGTGLGLAMVQGVVAQSGGHIDVESEPGHGTTFRIYLPARGEAAAGLPAPASTVPALGGRETIMVVEDLPDVRVFAAGMLKAYGYRVLQAESGEEALRICQDEPGRIDLLLTDVVMPNMNGRELAGRLQNLRPGIKVLFMSGYTDNTLAGKGVLDEGVQFIEKPFGAEALARKVRAVLGPPGPARILVADEEAGVRDLLREILQQTGHEVVEAADTVRALREMRPGEADLVIVDLSAEQEQLDAIRTLHARVPGIRFIALSGALEEEFRKTAQEAGVDVVLKKPLNTELLLASVADLLEPKGLRNFS